MCNYFESGPMDEMSDVMQNACWTKTDDKSPPFSAICSGELIK